MKQCQTCKEMKHSSEYTKDMTKADGLCYQCKPCVAISKKIYYQDNQKQIIVVKRKYYQDNKEEISAIRQEHYQTHRSECDARGAQRRAMILNATVSYSSKKAIQRIYRTANILSKMVGRQFHVDHIIPLQGKLVCGLHHEGNLQIISAERNRSKGNRFKPIIK